MKSYNEKPYKICRDAIAMFSEQGYEHVSMADISRGLEIPEAELYSYFGKKEDIVLLLYQQINTNWQLSVEAIPHKKLARRFEEGLRIKLKLVEPYVNFLSQIIGFLIQATQIGVNSPRTSHIRRIGAESIQGIIDQSRDGQKLQKKLPQLASIMYFLHWAVLFTRIQRDDQDKLEEVLSIISSSFNQPRKILWVNRLFPIVGKISLITENALDIKATSRNSLDREILKVIFNIRKLSDPKDPCANKPCESCFELHEASINFFTSQNKAIHFILPAFPAKSPNSSKTLGKLPDLGEEIALKSLESLCQEIESIYKAGAQVTICSDGRIFSELVGVSDQDITAYVSEISRMIREFGLDHLHIVNLEDLSSGKSFGEMREKILSEHAEPLEDLKLNIKNKAEMTHLFNGIHRFISEDRMALGEPKSKTQVKKESKEIAIKVIQHSNAWTRFLANVYPEAIRLSIHPYPSNNRKIGIQLTKAEDNWLTPWHGVITLNQNGYQLMKRKKAEEMGAALIRKDNRAYYYSMLQE
ncbi:MAG: L-tyrosine/L-tryptophan isonitrile synthase family protein [Bacteroidia bacterium]|nr:L-tyrosine/L-tryptophan isonitrile synthase family protein [Bacteroidia bacterium]